MEEVALRGGLGAVAVVDIDHTNCFGLFEWPATLDAVGEHLPELEPWVRCTTEPDHVRLPCGGTGLRATGALGKASRKDRLKRR